MNKPLSTILATATLVALAGPAVAQSPCENMRVIVRNGVYAIQGLEAFCAEFNKIKSELASMKSALSNERAHTALLEARLAAQSTHDAAPPKRYPQSESHTEE